MKKIQFARIINTFIVILFLLSALHCSENVPPPELSGTWKAGSATVELKNGDEWFQVRAWYPAQEESENKLLSSDPYTIQAFAEIFGIPSFLLGDPVKSRSGLKVKIPTGKFPVILFNHGLLSYERQNTFQFEQLASHGYIVLSVSTPGESAVIVRENGEVVFMNKEGMAYTAYRKQGDNLEKIAPGLKRKVDHAKESALFPEYAKRMAILARDPTFSDMLPIFDKVYRINTVLLNRLPEINNGKIKSEISGHMDLDHIGAFGHSFGSIISGMLAMQDHRVRAAMGFDAPQLNVWSDHYVPFPVPVCYAYADEFTISDQTLTFSGINHPLLAAKGSCEALFRKSAHYNFSDLNQISFLRYSPMLGDVDNTLMAENLETLILAFFNTHLKNKNELEKIQMKGVELQVY